MFSFDGSALDDDSSAEGSVLACEGPSRGSASEPSTMWSSSSSGTSEDVSNAAASSVSDAVAGSASLGRLSRFATWSAQEAAPTA